MRVSGIKGGAPRASPLPQDMLYTFSGRCIFSGGKGELLLHAWYKHRLRDEYTLQQARSATISGSMPILRSLSNGVARASELPVLHQLRWVDFFPYRKPIGYKRSGCGGLVSIVLVLVLVLNLYETWARMGVVEASSNTLVTPDGSLGSRNITLPALRMRIRTNFETASNASFPTTLPDDAKNDWYDPRYLTVSIKRVRAYKITSYPNSGCGPWVDSFARCKESIPM